MPVKNAPKTMLFKLEHANAPAASYLFGTVHVRDQRAFTFFEKAKSAIEKCDRFAAEFDLRDANPDVFQMATHLPDGQTIDGFLTKPLFKKLEKRMMRDHKMPAEAFLQMHPTMLSAMLSEPFLGTESAVALDEALLNFADQSGKMITGVETFMEQVEVFEKLSIEESAKNLTFLIKNHGRVKKRVKQMLDLYAAGDVRQLYKSARKQSRGLRETLIFERNDRMTDRIAAFSLEMSTFSAIGAGHLGGKKGVLAGLKRAGFAVKPV